MGGRKEYGITILANLPALFRWKNTQYDPYFNFPNNVERNAQQQ